MVADASQVRRGNDSFGSLRERSCGFKCCTEHFLTFLTLCVLNLPHCHRFP